MEYGYARCSTNETKPDFDRQVRELKAAGTTAEVTDQLQTLESRTE